MKRYANAAPAFSLFAFAHKREVRGFSLSRRFNVRISPFIS